MSPATYRFPRRKSARAKYLRLRLILARPAGLRTHDPGRERYKTGRTLVVPLSQPARELIDALPCQAGGDYAFSTTAGRRPISGYSKMKRRFDATLALRCDGREPFDFDLHDLRRTVRTNLSALRVPPHVAEAVLGHVVTGVQKHYDKWTYLDEKREALEAWGRKVQSLIAPGTNAVSFNRPR